MTPEEIAGLIARMGQPGQSSEPLDSEQALSRLIHEGRNALSPSRRRQRARVFVHQSPEFTSAMLRIEDASAEELRGFVRDVVDLLWGEGEASSKREPRRLDFDKVWEVKTIEEVAAALSRRSFFPFHDGRARGRRPTFEVAISRRSN